MHKTYLGFFPGSELRPETQTGRERAGRVLLDQLNRQYPSLAGYFFFETFAMTRNSVWLTFDDENRATAETCFAISSGWKFYRWDEQALKDLEIITKEIES